MSLVVRELVRQLVNTMFISNNRKSQKHRKHRKVSKHYEADCKTTFRKSIILSINWGVHPARLFRE